MSNQEEMFDFTGEEPWTQGGLPPDPGEHTFVVEKAETNRSSGNHPQIVLHLRTAPDDWQAGRTIRDYIVITANNGPRVIAPFVHSGLDKPPPTAASPEAWEPVAKTLEGRTLNGTVDSRQIERGERAGQWRKEVLGYAPARQIVGQASSDVPGDMDGLANGQAGSADDRIPF
jgi:hypothetical protein